MSYDLESLSMKHLEGIVHILNQSTDSFIYIYNLTDDIYFISPAARNIFAISGEKIEGASKEIMKIVYEEDKNILMTDLDALKTGHKSEHNLEYRWVNKNGKPVWISCRGRIVPNFANGKKILIGTISITEEEDKADLLTGLSTETQLRTDFANHWTKHQCVSGFLLKIDVDNIKIINEQYGVSTGDLIISKVGDCCRKVCSGVAKAYKLASDEFICMNLSGKSAPVAQKLFEALRREISEVDNGLEYDVVFTISGGAVAFMKETSQLDELLKKVNYTVSCAKKEGKNKLVTFNAVDYSRHLRNLDVQAKMRDAIKNNFSGFELYYQPIINAQKMYLDKDKTVQNVIGAEALLRWSCPGYGMLSPDEFVPILERTGMIVSVGRWILRTGFTQCREWCRIQKDFRLSVNLSYIQVMRSDILRDVETALLISGVNPKNITLELTESGFIDNGVQLHQLTENLSSLGVNVDIDDFGTGYSNLRYLQYLKASTLKLDYSFVQKAIGGNEGDKKIIRHITEMAHELNMKICMEGIESAEDIEKLIIYSPDKFQGFYFGRPCSKIDFQEHHIRPDVRRDVYEK